jgi:hypothetical protein
METSQMQALENQAEISGNKLEIRQFDTVSIDRITLEPDQLKYFWAVGILNDTAYVAFALQVDKRQYKSMKAMDFGAFAERWCFVGEDARSKFLKHKQIRDAIQKLELCGFIKLEQQLSLKLNY